MCSAFLPILPVSGLAANVAFLTFQAHYLLKLNRLCALITHLSYLQMSKQTETRLLCLKSHYVQVLSANFNSIECHNTEFWNLLDRTNPDIIIRVETKLDSSITNSQRSQ